MGPGNIPKNNNFDLIRLLLSLTVFFVHSYDLSGNPGLSMIPVFLNTHTAVCAFFVISGFLVSSSFANSSGRPEYFSKRLRRILPAYVAVVLICGLGGAGFTEFPYREYFSLPLLHYLGANLTFLNFMQPSLPGVFAGNASQAVNGALWTIRFELLFYLIIPLLFWLTHRFKKGAIFFLIFLAILIFRIASVRLLQGRSEDQLITSLSYYLPVLFIAFASGAFLYYYFGKFRQNALLFLVISAAGFIIAKIFDLPLFRPLFLSVIVIYLACSFPYLGNAGKYGDLSYGIYIWHFPVLQVMIAQGFFKENALLPLLSATLIVAVLAFMSWHIIEKPFLKRSSHYRLASERGMSIDQDELKK